MDILDAIKKRKSIRAYKPDAVPKAVIREILEKASRAPSAMNTQPWEFAVVAGEPLRKIREENVAKIQAGEIPQPEHQVAGWPNDSVYRVRQVDLAQHIFQIMDISREDKVKRAAWLTRGFGYFDAPAAIIIFVDKTVAGSRTGGGRGRRHAEHLPCRIAFRTRHLHPRPGHHVSGCSKAIHRHPGIETPHRRHLDGLSGRGKHRQHNYQHP